MNPTTAAVAEEVATSPTMRAFDVIFGPDKAHVRHLRQITAAYLGLWNVSGPLAEDIVLAVSELITNGVLHGQGDIGLRVLCTCHELRVEVTDGNPTPATLHNASADDESGRGLFLAAVLAQTWGVSDDGRTTWCTFRRPATATLLSPTPTPTQPVTEEPAMDLPEDQPAHLPTVEQTWCDWHHGYTDTGCLITAEEQCSGPGTHQYACAPCREKHQLTPWSEPTSP